MRGVRVVMMTVSFGVEFLRAEEGLEPEAEHVEGGHAGGDKADEPEELAEWIRASEGAEEDLVLGEEASQRREAGVGTAACRNGQEGVGVVFREAALVRMSCSPERAWMT